MGVSARLEVMTRRVSLQRWKETKFASTADAARIVAASSLLPMI